MRSPGSSRAFLRPCPELSERAAQVLDRFLQIGGGHGVAHEGIACLSQQHEADLARFELLVAAQLVEDAIGADILVQDKRELEMSEETEDAAGFRRR